MEGRRCDGDHWRLRTVGLCLGLLHECSLREAQFVRLVWASPHPLTLLGTEGNRLTSTPVQVQRLASVLAVHPAGPPLSIIANYIRVKNTPSSSLLCSPSVPVLTMSLLNHISLSGQEIPLLSETQEAYIQSCCVEGLLLDLDEDTSLLSSLMLMPLGADIPTNSTPHIDQFNDLKSFRNTLSSEIAISTKEKGVDPDEHNSPHPKPALSLRDVVLQLLLTSISSSPIDGRNLGIRLLGLTDVVQKRLTGQAYQKALSDPSPNKPPVNCLEAIIHLLNAGHISQGAADAHLSDDDVSTRLPLMFSAPEQAMKGYELLYLLCSSPVTSSIVLAWLRHNNINFVNKQLNLCLEVTEKVLDVISNNSIVPRDTESDFDRYNGNAKLGS